MLSSLSSQARELILPLIQSKTISPFSYVFLSCFHKSIFSLINFSLSTQINELNHPYSICCGKNNIFYVCDYGKGLLRFTKPTTSEYFNHNLLFFLTELFLAQQLIHIDKPVGVAYCHRGDCLFVCEWKTHSILRVNLPSMNFYLLYIFYRRFYLTLTNRSFCGEICREWTWISRWW